jgi:hypothetical protein
MFEGASIFKECVSWIWKEAGYVGEVGDLSYYGGVAEAASLCGVTVCIFE